MNKHLKWVINEWKRYKSLVVIMFFLTILTSFISSVYPYLFKVLIDKIDFLQKNKADYDEPMQEIYRFIWVILGIGAVRLVTSIYPAVRAWINMKFEHSLRMRYFTDITEKDYKFFNKFRTGDLVTRLTNDLTDFPKIAWFLCSGIFRAFNSLVNIIFIMSMMFFLNWKLTLYSLTPLPVMIIVFYLVSTSLEKRYSKNQEAISSINSQLELSFSGIKIIKAFDCEEKYNRFFDIALEERYNTEYSLIKLQAGLNLIYEYIGYLGQIAILFFGGYMAVKGTITIGTFLAFYTYLMMMIYPMLDLPQLFISGKQAFVNIDRLEEIKNFPNENQRFSNEVPVDRFDSLKFSDTSFGYQEKALFTNLNLEIDSHKKTLLMGEVGCGKSTLISLLTGLIKPDSGEILINNINVDKLKRDDFLNSIGYVPQDPLLFSGTIHSNVTFGVKEIDQELYRQVLETSQLDNEIAGFEKRDKTILGEKGTAVSGGQKQRIAIARALMRKPKFLILDDITSSLDAENERKLWVSMNKYFPETGALMVSHRISTVAYADEIIFINKEHHCFKGTHLELHRNNPQYRDFIQSQMTNGKKT
ncbi:ABC transporter ATP-binding protein [bacterium]|nr:ABC transporter ATP-binding protein [bacterium]